MIAALIQSDAPKTFDDLIARMNKAFHELTNYADSWDLTEGNDATKVMRFSRRIDGKRVWFRLSMLDTAGAGETMSIEEAANGHEIYIVNFKTKSYYLGKDDGSLSADADPVATPKGSLYLGASTYTILVICKPTPILTSIQTVPGEVAGARVATAEATNPETKNSVSLRLTFLNRWWIPADITATVHFVNGTQSIGNLHARTLMMNAKFPAHPFDLNPKLIQGFKRKSLADLQKDMSVGAG